jgi:predicted ArsR family transcriptional regulator
VKKVDYEVPAQAESAVGVQIEDDASTRARVASSILEHGPSTASDLAKRLHLTPAAVRRHLSVLLQVGHLASREQRVYGHRGRGRPAKVFLLTDRGRAEFYQAYDRLAIQALDYLRQTSGPDSVRRFADGVTEGIESRFNAIKGEYGTPLEALVQALTDGGYVASLQPVASGQQLCQHHCPVAHVAAEFPELCEAETRAFARLLGSHVQRLATIAHGDGVCNTHVPRPVTAADHPRKG